MIGTPVAKGRPGLLDSFNYVRIINLPARADRRRSVTAQLAALGTAIDGKDIAFARAVCPSDAGDFETIGTCGCFMSHLETLKAARAEGAAHLLILEDDVGFSRAERSAMPAVLAALAQQDWGILYGGSPVAPLARP